MTETRVRPRLRARAFEFPYLSCRNITSPEDQGAGRRILVGHAPATSFINLEDNENVRDYLVDAAGKQKRSPTLVHQAIRKTLKDNPQDFCVLNSGVCIVARAADVREAEKILSLVGPSIINGSQTQGELKRYFEKTDPKSDGYVIPSVKFELIVTDDDALIAEVSIARNFQNDVKSISIAGRKGQLDELERAIQQRYSHYKLRKSETDLSEEYFDTEKLIQVLFALCPDRLLDGLDNGQADRSKVFTYSQKTRCLKLFQKIYENKDESACADVYRYFLDMAADALELYLKWKTHQNFIGTRLRAIQRSDDGREIVEVPDGIIFPILSALSAFVRPVKGQWKIAIPNGFDDAILIGAAAQDYQEIAGHNPQTMGKNKACYSSLLRITQIYAKLTKK